jgi:hypothetical protein
MFGCPVTGRWVWAVDGSGLVDATRFARMRMPYGLEDIGPDEATAIFGLAATGGNPQPCGSTLDTVEPSLEDMMRPRYA